MLKRGVLGDFRSSCTRERSWDGILGLLNQRENSIKTSLSKWNFQGCPWSESECARGGNIGGQNVFKTCVVRHIEENRSPTNARPWRAANSFCGLSWWHYWNYDFQLVFLFSWPGSRLAQSCCLDTLFAVPLGRARLCAILTPRVPSPCHERLPVGCYQLLSDAP